MPRSPHQRCLRSCPWLTPISNRWDVAVNYYARFALPCSAIAFPLFGVCAARLGRMSRRLLVLATASAYVALFLVIDPQQVRALSPFLVAWWPTLSIAAIVCWFGSYAELLRSFTAQPSYRRTCFAPAHAVSRFRANGPYRADWVLIVGGDLRAQNHTNRQSPAELPTREHHWRSAGCQLVGWVTGFEPATSGATVRRSATELHPPFRTAHNYK